MEKFFSVANIGPTRRGNHTQSCESNINKKLIKSQTFIHRAISFFAPAAINCGCICAINIAALQTYVATITVARGAVHFFGVCGVLVALKTSGFDTRNMLGNIVANVPNTSSDIPCNRYRHESFSFFS